MPNPESLPALLLHTPYGKDAQHLCNILGERHFDCKVCHSVPELAEQIDSSVTAILVTEEIFTSPDLAVFLTALQNQPAWSAIPILLFYSNLGGDEGWGPRTTAQVREIADIHFIQRPVSTFTLVSAVQGAMRDRRRQYRTRDLFEQLEQARLEAEAANHSKSSFLANMSHEIRTPLSAILGYADLLAIPDLEEEQKAEFVSVIRRNSKQLLRIIDDILDLSKVESGRMTFESVELRLVPFLDEIKSLLGVRAQENGIDFEIQAGDDLPERVISDPVRVKQILLNIVGNAIKFTERGKIELLVSYADKSLTFRVRDTGCGISQVQSEMLFHHFVQADSSTTRKYGGTGLGLVITRRICEAMGGEFFLAESEPGKGSTFVARIRVEVPPSGAAAGGTAHPEARPPDSLKGTKILLVEDSQDNRALVCFMLTKAEASVDTASDGVEAVEKALRETYDAIVMDVQMPRMDGLEAVRILREKGLSLPVVALTAHAMKEEQERCSRAGFSGFLSKPVDQRKLLELLHLSLSSSETRRAS